MSAKRKQPSAVIGVGASAGGLEYLKRLVGQLPADKALSVIVVQHIEPSHESRLADLLARETRLHVKQAEEGEKLAPDTVYTIPSNSSIAVEGGAIRVTEPRSQRLRRLPIDILFTSIAKEYQDRAIGVVLTGNGSDGTGGIKAIKEHQGLTIAQSPNEAPHDGMPRSAINSGAVDKVCSIDGVVETIDGYLELPENILPVSEKPEGDPLEPILERLFRETGHDFWKYKRATLKRRIERRIGLSGSRSLEEYVQHLDDAPDELNALLQDLLITVTRFFRDAEAFEALGRALDEMIANWSQVNGRTLRVWVPGCSTGEEAYSIAIVAMERIARSGRELAVQVFGTDIEPAALETARTGEYGDYVAGQIPEHHLAKHFKEIENGYRVRKHLRDAVMFSEQNLLGDPPFSNLDLISCRNVLIYLDRAVHDNLVALFHFALRERGLLFLGSSETIGSNESLFGPFDRKHCVYRRRTDVAPRYPGLPVEGSSLDRPAIRGGGEKPDIARPEAATLRTLADEFGPAAVTIDADDRVRYVHGSVNQFVEVPPGEPDYHFPKLLKRGLGARVMAAVREVRTGKHNRHEEILRFRDDDAWRETRLVVTRAKDSSGLVVVAFAPSQASSPASGSQLDEVTIHDQVVRSLESELESTKQELHTKTEEMESSNEELKASNEEIMSMNEELQSTNEELETAKEETQSLNEELQTVNAELEEKISQLEDANQDLENLLESSGLATLFLDTGKSLRRYSQTAAALFGLYPSDLGQPLEGLPARLRTAIEESELDNALRSEGVNRREATIENSSYLTRVLPYYRADDSVGGVVVTFTEISELKRAQNELSTALERYRSLTENSQDIIVRYDREVRYLYVNSRVSEIVNLDPDDFIGKTNRDLGFPQELCDHWDDVVTRTVEHNDVQHSQFSLTDRNGQKRHFDWMVVPESREGGAAPTVLSVARDVTDRVNARESLERALEDREVLIQEVHHRVKNNLFMLIGLLQMEEQKLSETLTDPQPVIESLQTVMRRIQVISSIYTYLYQSMGDAETVRADSFVLGLAELVGRAYSDRNATVRAEADPVRVPVDTAISIGLIINEAVTNAFKYAFPANEEGTVELALRRDGSADGVVEIVDNGVGIEDGAGTDGDGLGFRLIRMLAKQIRGSLDIQGGGGTTIRIEFPLDEEPREKGREDGEGSGS